MYDCKMQCSFSIHDLVVAFNVEGAMKSNHGFPSAGSPSGTYHAPLRPQSSPRTFPSEAVVRDITVRGKPWRGVTFRQKSYGHRARSQWESEAADSPPSASPHLVPVICDADRGFEIARKREVGFVGRCHGSRWIGKERG
jgi:hypothetical protein